jgi:hypothetical protein
VRLDNQKPMKKFVDQTWIRSYVDPLGRVVRPNANNFLQNEQGWLTPDEVKMIRSGATFNDILFLRAQKAQQRTVLDRR